MQDLYDKLIGFKTDDLELKIRIEDLIGSLKKKMVVEAPIYQKHKIGETELFKFSGKNMYVKTKNGISTDIGDLIPYCSLDEDVYKFIVDKKTVNEIVVELARHPNAMYFVHNMDEEFRQKIANAAYDCKDLNDEERAKILDRLN